MSLKLDRHLASSADPAEAVVNERRRAKPRIALISRMNWTAESGRSAHPVESLGRGEPALCCSARLLEVVRINLLLPSICSVAQRNGQSRRAARSCATRRSARRVGSGSRWPRTQDRTNRTASFRLIRWPTLTKMGFDPCLDLSTIPSVSSPSRREAASPRFGPGSGWVPKRRDFAQPIAGNPVIMPRWHAMPNRRGCARPWPSHTSTSGVVRSFRSAAIRAGASRKESSPGI